MNNTKKNCKYVKACGSNENCLNCSGFQEKKGDKMKGNVRTRNLTESKEGNVFCMKCLSTYRVETFYELLTGTLVDSNCPNCNCKLSMAK